jgi:hypothetical protein
MRIKLRDRKKLYKILNDDSVDEITEKKAEENIKVLNKKINSLISYNKPINTKVLLKK